MEIKFVLVSELKPHPKNRNIHNDPQLNRLSKLINYQGFRIPLIVSNRSGYIVAGHGRLESAKKNGLKELPVIFQDFETEEQEFSFMTSDNAIAMWAKLDLSEINKDIIDLGPELDIELLGIKNFNLDMSEKQKRKCPKCSYEW